MARSIRSRFIREPAVLIQQAAGDRNEYGEYVDGVETRTAVKVSSAPAGGKVRNLLPEGARIEDARSFWLETEAAPLRVGTDQADSDRLEHGGLSYRLRLVDDWRPHGFIEALGIRVDAQDG